MGLLTVKETAERLSCSASNVYALASSGELECYRIGRGKSGLRFSDEQIQTFLEKRKMGGQPQKEPPALRPIKLNHLKF